MNKLSLLFAILAGTCAVLDGWPGAMGLAPWTLLTMSFAVMLAVTLLHAGANHLTSGLNSGQYSWQQRMRQRLGLEPAERMREASWLKASLMLLIWGSAPLLIMQLWGLGDVSRKILDRAISAGIPLGELTIVPAKVVLGVIVVALLITLIRSITHKLEHQWLASAQMDAPVREVIATLVGYAAIGVATMFALTVAGFDLSKLAFVAGALGVGIGFGLQNIVNNFVSGLILLFERPIRSGDFITIGSNEGWVRKIRIRATEVETLSHQHIIIPNSQFIAEPVTNWSLRDPTLRITLKVGVAYGSDTQLVKKLLIDVAEAHPLVLNKNQQIAPTPQVLFKSFGDSSLDFELKVFIQDASKRFVVTSDLNFAIDQAFREHQVTIPFPQRDLWFKNAIPNDAQ